MESLEIKVFTESECEQFKARLLTLTPKHWVDGKATTGSHAKTEKINLQLKPDTQENEDLEKAIRERLRNNQSFKSFCIPKKLHHNLISRTEAGGGYGTHVDNAFMKTGRADISYTICLSSENDYKGGELVIHGATETSTIKIKQGHAFIYPSNQLHQVNTVTSGIRLACIGWVQSYIASQELRMNLFNLEAGANYLLATQGRSEALDRIFLAHSHLFLRLHR